MSPDRFSLLFFACALATAAACYTGPDIDATSNASPTTPEATVGSEAAPNGLPCEIATLIQEHCASCHASPPRTGAKSTVTSREELLGDWEGRPLGVVSLERMRDEASPMPPEGLLPEADIAVFQKWVDDGMPEGTCGEVSEEDAPPITLTCTSGRFWDEGDDEGDELMTPGQACIACHTEENVEHAKKHADDPEEAAELEAPAFSAAGTVYRTLHEPDDCFGRGGAGTKVILTGADGAELTLDVNRAGNFMTEERLALPYTARVVRAGKSREMRTPQEDGDCNGCHTAEGGDAPGRIVGP